MQDFRKLRVWHVSQEVADRVYEITSGFPASQQNGLTSQLRRASDSISANIAEGCGRATQKEKAHFLHIALGSVNEVDNGLIRACRIGLLRPAVHDPLQMQVTDVRKMLASLIETIRQS